MKWKLNVCWINKDVFIRDSYLLFFRMKIAKIALRYIIFFATDQINDISSKDDN